ncbi:MAG TPA: hypothetical protein VH413_13400 [Verrucomicrobiae bacterium]|jgi:hypothetical protein|nr:hypothetical protein [Verrucomicrobiae bacterium]
MKILLTILFLGSVLAANCQTVFCEMYVLNGWTNEVVLQFKDANFAPQSLTLPIGGRFQAMVPTGSTALVNSYDPASITNGPYDIPYYQQQNGDVPDTTTNDWIILIGSGDASSGSYSMQWTEYRDSNIASQFGFVPPSSGSAWPSPSQQVADVVEGFEFGVGPAFLLFAIYMIRRGLQPAIQE